MVILEGIVISVKFSVVGDDKIVKDRKSYQIELPPTEDAFIEALEEIHKIWEGLEENADIG